MATVTAQRKCSMCRQPGHTKRTCPQRTVPSQAIEAADCPICMEPLGNGNATTCTTPCGHRFCMQCLVTHQQTKSNCPLCRADLPGVAAPPAQRPAPLPALAAAHARIATILRAAPPPRLDTRFPVYLQNHSSITVDVWWLPGGAQPARLIEFNVVPGTVRRITVGDRGHRFSLARLGPYAPLVEFQANAPNINFVYTGTTLVELD